MRKNVRKKALDSNAEWEKKKALDSNTECVKVCQ